MENVKALLSSNGGWDFARVIIEMDKVGYDAEWAVLNSSDVVPQNRERVYIIGHLRGTSTRQVFPIQRQGTDLARPNPKIRVVGNTSSTDHKSQNVISSNGISPTLTASDYKHPKQVAVRQVGNIVKQKGFSNPQRGRIYSANGLSPTLNTAQGGGLEPKVLIERPQKASQTKVLLGKYKRNEYGKAIRKAYESGKIKVRRKDLKKFSLKKSNVSNTLTTVQKDNLIGMVKTDKIEIDSRRFKENGKPTFTANVVDRNGVMLKNGDVVAIRKLTPRECWRLQGFSDEQFEKAKKAGISDTQLYKQAGNAVTVDVIEQIGKRLVLEDDEAKKSSNFGINNKN
ncbi:DNA (cytosine-5-)-methyltransferase [Lactobacillus johnsonii]|uniref:DNA (cytosine-5-)-methyltransferase n=1 Tax=Lactobacillus johnsonii TaxID=33959 RepID=UPI000BA3DA5A|nr:DNA (cytosine-5-)-methyltransferase [Lactobacillus johnsonii]